MFKFIERTKIWFTISIILTIIGIASLAINGLNLGIDFKGGTLLEVSMGKTITAEELSSVESIVKNYDSNATLNTAVDNTQVDIKSDSEKLDEETVTKIVNEVKEKFPDSSLKSQERIGASIGTELTKKAVIAVLLSSLAILIYVAIRFEFKFGLAAVIALVHDVMITLTFYSVFKIQVDTPFIAAILTVVGYSINDTIVVFDRIRENLKTMKKEETSYIANLSINQVVKRSVYTVTTTLITISCVTIFVPQVRNFGLPLIIGILSGCYSSIFIATPLWLLFNKKGKNKVSA
ncbi:MAG: protein translocase subunit SecF [Clostridiaceae bacterium]